MSQWYRELDVRVKYGFIAKWEEMRECRYCRSEFKSRWVKPTEDEMYGHFRPFCSVLCARLWKEEQREK